MSNAPPALPVKANGQPGVAPAGGSTVQPGGQGKTDKFGEGPITAMSQQGVDFRSALKEFGYRVERMDSEGRERLRSATTGDVVTLFPSGWCNAVRRNGKALRAIQGLNELREHLKHRHGNSGIARSLPPERAAVAR